MYRYDFGAGWDHDIEFEGKLAPDIQVDTPLCLEGERACPPEDCWGIGGYGELLKAVKAPENDDYGWAIEWLGEGLDPESFDHKAANRRMKEAMQEYFEMS